MEQKRSERPGTARLSNFAKTEYAKSDSKKKKNPFQKSGTWVQCENDKIVTDEKLKKLIQDEDEHHYQADLRNFVRCHFSDKQTADDICQEVWAIMLAKVSKETIFQSGLKGYVGKVAYGVILNERRKRSKRNHDSIDQKTGGEIEAYLLPERRMASPEVIVLLKEVLNFLEPREQKVFILDYYGYKDNEIAEELGIQPNNIRVIRYRASRRLAEYMKQRKLYDDFFGR